MSTDRSTPARPIARTKLLRLAFLIIIGSLLSAAPNAAYARARETPLSGDMQSVVSGPPAGVQQVGKWRMFTGAPLSGTFAFSGNGVSLAGTLTRLVNVRIDAELNGTLMGTISYVDTQTGVTCTGFHHGKLINNFLTGTVVASCSDGTLLRGTLQDTEITYDNQGILSSVTTHFTGTLLNPHA